MNTHPLALLWNVYELILLARVVLSWTGTPPAANGFALFVYRATEPLLVPLRRLVPPERLGGLDISPAIVLVLGHTVVGLLLSLI